MRPLPIVTTITEDAVDPSYNSLKISTHPEWLGVELHVLIGTMLGKEEGKGRICLNLDAVSKLMVTLQTAVQDARNALDKTNNTK